MLPNAIHTCQEKENANCIRFCSTKLSVLVFICVAFKFSRQYKC